MTDWMVEREAVLVYSYEYFAQAKVFVFRKWCEKAAEQKLLVPTDLSGACIYGSLFMNHLFGGTIRGHYQHQFNLIEGRIVDLSHDAMDVGKMTNPYLHEPGYFIIPEKNKALDECIPRIDDWVIQFLAELEKLKIS
ncbi:MAG: transcriptional regulator [Methylococcaceae bacterium]|jgi:hypothetical protein